MAKKIAPKLIETSQVIYAVLSPGEGFLKELYGEVYFVDMLPRASGCFVTKDEAVAASVRAIGKARLEVEAGEEKLAKAGRVIPTVHDAHMYFINRARNKFKQAQDAIVVEISLRGVV